MRRRPPPATLKTASPRFRGARAPHTLQCVYPRAAFGARHARRQPRAARHSQSGPLAVAARRMPPAARPPGLSARIRRPRGRQAPRRSHRFGAKGAHAAAPRARPRCASGAGRRGSVAAAQHLTASLPDRCLPANKRGRGVLNTCRVSTVRVRARALAYCYYHVRARARTPPTPGRGAPRLLPRRRRAPCRSELLPRGSRARRAPANCTAPAPPTPQAAGGAAAPPRARTAHLHPLPFPVPGARLHPQPLAPLPYQGDSACADDRAATQSESVPRGGDRRAALVGAAAAASVCNTL